MALTVGSPARVGQRHPTNPANSGAKPASSGAKPSRSLSAPTPCHLLYSLQVYPAREGLVAVLSLWLARLVVQAAPAVSAAGGPP